MLSYVRSSVEIKCFFFTFSVCRCEHPGYESLKWIQTDLSLSFLLSV